MISISYRSYETFNLTKEEFLSGNQKYFISVTYRLGGEGLEDNGIKPALKLYYNADYWADTYPVSDTKVWSVVPSISNPALQKAEIE